MLRNTGPSLPFYRLIKTALIFANLTDEAWTAWCRTRRLSEAVAAALREVRTAEARQLAAAFAVNASFVVFCAGARPCSGTLSASNEGVLQPQNRGKDLRKAGALVP